MSETQAKRPPPVAPKPSFIGLDRVKSQSAAYPSRTSPSAGALQAATIAGKKTTSPPKSPAPGASYRSTSPNRGRAPRPDVVGNAQTTVVAPAPMLSRSVSAIAARYASANTSPVRVIQSDGKNVKDNAGGRGRQDNNATGYAMSRAGLRGTTGMPDSFTSPPPLNSMARTISSNGGSSMFPSLPSPTSNLTLTRSLTTTSSVSDSGSTLGRHMMAGTMRKLDRSISQEIHTPAAKGRNGDLKHASSTSSNHHSKTVPIPIEGTRSPRRVEGTATPQTNSVPGSNRGSMTASTLADAMVASSLASSRTPSPAKKGPKPLPIRRRSRSMSGLETSTRAKLPPPLPAPRAIRPMKHTLRQHSPEKETDNEPVRRGRRHWVRKHPNKHHEGDRKRWRDRVTEQEKKRYEGVWAANRGHLMSYDRFTTDGELSSRSAVSKDLVTNVVVKDIWNRSRLPHDILEEIWDLVAPDKEKALNKDEFVVGLWLIDQRLKGRKLPFKVSASVWSSVRHIQGVKISNKRLS